jgi:hypothetical protein
MAEAQRSCTDDGVVDVVASAAPFAGPTLSEQHATRLLRGNRPHRIGHL